MKIQSTLIGSFIICLCRTSNSTTVTPFTSNTLESKVKMSSRNHSELPPYESGTNSVAFITTPDDTIAKKLSHEIIKQKLAACVNIIPQVTSIYSWEGKINEDSEVLMMVKTTTERLEELTKFIRENHPYSVAEVITLPIQNGNPSYLDWISKTVQKNAN